MIKRALIIMLFVSGCASDKTYNNKILPDNITQDVVNPGLDWRAVDLVTDKQPWSKMIADTILKNPEEETFKGANTIISLSINEDISVRDVLYHIAKESNLDVEMDPDIEGRIIMSIKDKTLVYVLKNLCDRLNVRYYVTDGIIHFVKDEPYSNYYKVDFLNMVKSISSSFSVDTKVLGSGGDSGGASATGSSSSSSMSYEDNIWQAIEDGMKAILNHYDYLYNRAKKNQAEIIKIANEKEAERNKEVDGKGSAKTHNISYNADSYTSSYNINKQSGIVNVFSTSGAHKDIEKYLKNVRKSVFAQILIEAKIVEITLKESHASGIDWALYDSNLPFNGGGLSNYELSGPGSAVVSNSGYDITGETGTLNVKGLFKVMSDKSILANMNMLAFFGKTTTLSSPRITAINNQQAVITFIRNFVYFETKITSDKPTNSPSSGSGAAGGGNANNAASTIGYEVSSTMKSVPVGIVLSIQPSADPATGEISMTVRPTLSRVVDYVNNPATEIALKHGNVTGLAGASRVPVVEMRSMDSVVKLKSGNVMVIGGMHEVRTLERQKGLPKLKDIPLIGRIFGSTSETNDHIETVILLKATIIDSASDIRNESADWQRYASGFRDK